MHLRFSYQALTAGKYEVGIAGDFTEWKILSLQDFGGLYLIDFDLKPGKYRYKYIIDEVWRTDPNNPETEADPFGGMNSIIEVGEEKVITSWDQAILDASAQDARSFITCYRPSADLMELRFAWYPSLADDVTLIFDGDEARLYPLGRKNGLMIWHTCRKFTRPKRFHVRICYKDEVAYLGLQGFGVDVAKSIPFTVNPADYPVFQTPEWLQGGLIYQIFTDRFCNGKPSNDQDFREPYYAANVKPEPGEILGTNREYFRLITDWKDIQPLRQSPWQEPGIPDWHCFYGGDIAGVIQKLDYLKDMGINIIYFNPLWEAKSNHKYDAADFAKPDPHFATEAELKELLALAHANGIRVILDVAFNHSGESFWAFQDTVEKGDKSAWWTWYDWFKWPLPNPLPEDFRPRDYYQCWWGIKDMPDLNFDLSRRHPYENYIRDINNADVNWDLVNHILDSASWWISEIGMDGFRLDVPDEVPWWFWQLFRERIKGLKPDAWLVGEIWHNAGAWISERYFDSVMNYAYFKNPVLEFFIHQIIDDNSFKLRIEEGLASYPTHANAAMMNLLGSHDTQRIRHLAHDDFSRIRYAVFFQMTFVGVPHIYYGDEIGMDGGKDPDNRRPFDWDWQKNTQAVKLRDFYKRLILMRKNNPVLIDGEFRFVESRPGLLLYDRYYDDLCLRCAINYSQEDRVLGKTGEILFADGDVMPGAEGMILASQAMCIIKK